MSVDRLYKDGDIVWVKLGNNWWPAEVTDGYRQPEGLLSQVKYEPYCVVKFFQEDTYEIVKSSRQIYPFKCNKKEEFIRKGLAFHTAKNDFMEKFPSDVEIAERLTRRVVESDLLVINDRPYSILKAIIGQKLTRTRNDNYENDILPSCSEKRRSGDSVTKILNITPTRTNAAATNSSATNSSAYRCNFCDFTSLRQNVMILHNKTHSSGGAAAANNNATVVTTPLKSLPKSTTKSIQTTTPVEKKDTHSNNAPQYENRNNQIFSTHTGADTAITTNSSNRSTAITVNTNIVPHTTRKTRKEKSVSSPEAKTRAANVLHLLPHTEPKTLSTNLDNKPEEEDHLPVYLPLRKSLRSSPQINANRSLVASKLETTTTDTITTHVVTADEHSDEIIRTISNSLEFMDTPSEDVATIRRGKKQSYSPLKELEAADSKLSPEDILKSFHADWSDEEETTSVNTAVPSEIINAAEIKASTTTSKLPNSLNKSTEVDAAAASVVNITATSFLSTSHVSASTSTSGRIRNIPKKDRRDIILKEFPPNENNCNSQSSITSTTTPPVMTIDANISMSNSNSSEAVVVLFESLAATTVIEAEKQLSEVPAASAVTETISEHLSEVSEPICESKKYYITTSAPTESSFLTEPLADLVDKTTVVTDNVEQTATHTIVSTTITVQHPTSPVVPTWSCFDFEEDNDSDILTSIANFKKKHLSPDKNSTLSSCNNENITLTTKPEDKTEVAAETECKDKQLSAEIESLLQQTKTTVAEISTVASATREDVSVKALPIKERGKRIFKSRNRSRVEELPNAAVQMSNTNVVNTVVIAESATSSSSTEKHADISSAENLATKVNEVVALSEKENNGLEMHENGTAQTHMQHEDTAKNVEDVDNLNNVYDSTNVQNNLSTEVLYSVENVKNIESVKEAEPVENTINVNTENVENIEYVENIENVVNTENVENIENVAIAENIAKVDNIETVDNIEERVENMTNIEDIERAENIENITSNANIENIVKNDEIVDFVNNPEITENMQKNVDIVRSSDDPKNTETTEVLRQRTSPTILIASNEKEVVSENNSDETSNHEFKHHENDTNFLQQENKDEEEPLDKSVELQAEVEEPFVLRVSDVDTEPEQDTDRESIVVEASNNHIPIDDEIIPMIKHAPVEIYQEENNVEYILKVKPFSEDNHHVNASMSNEEQQQLNNNQQSPTRRENNAAMILSNLHIEDDSLHEAKETEQSLELPPSSRNNDMENEAAVSRFTTSPTDENSSIGISEAGAEFGSPTSMLDDERLPIVTGSLMTDIERISENLAEHTNETDVVIDKHLAECVRSLDAAETATDKIEVTNESPIKLEWGTPEGKENSEHESRPVEANTTLESVENAKNDDAALEHPAIQAAEIDKVETKEDVLSAQEEDEDEIESPPHEKLSGNEMDEEEKLEAEKHIQKKTKKRTRVATKSSTLEELAAEFEFENVQFLAQQTMPETPPEEREEKVNIETAEAVAAQPPQEEGGLEVSGVIKKDVEENNISLKPPRDNNRRSNRRVKRTSTDSDHETRVNPSRTQANAVNETKPTIEKNLNSEKQISCDVSIKTELKVELEAEATMDQLTESKEIQTTITTNEPMLLQEEKHKEHDLVMDSKIQKGAGKSKESVTRKRRSHIKITPRKRTAAAVHTSPVVSHTEVEEDESCCQTDSKLRRKSECLTNATIAAVPEAATKTTESAAEIVPTQTETTINTLATTTLNEMRSFRPRRKTNTSDTISDAKACEKSQQATQIATEIVEKFIIQAAAMQPANVATPPTTTTTRAPSPIEKVRINVDVANPLSSQIASILATTGQQQQRSRATDGNNPVTNKKVSVSNLPATTTISKSTMPSMKRKKSLEDDIPSFIIERPCMMSATAAEKEAFAHVQNKCPQVKITRKEKIIEDDDTAGVDSNQKISKDQATNNERSITTRSSSLQSPTQMLILNPTPAKQQKLIEIGGNTCPTTTLFDIGNMPILLTNEQLISENMHIVISPTTTTNVESVPGRDVATTLSTDKNTTEQQQPQQTMLLHVVPAESAAVDGSTTIQEQEQLQQQNKSRKTPTNSRTKRLPIRQQSLQQPQQEQQSTEQQQQKLTPHQKQLQEQQRLLQEQKQTCSQSNKQIGIDTRGNKYVIIKTPPSDLVVQAQQQQQHQEQQQLQQHSIVTNQPKAQSATFGIGAGITLQPIVDHQPSPVSPLDTLVSEEIVATEQQQQQQQKQKSPAAAATGGRKQAGNTITLPSSITVKQHQQQFNEALHNAAEVAAAAAATTDISNKTQTTSYASTLPVQKNLTKSTTAGGGLSSKNQNRNNSTSNRRSKNQQKQPHCLQQQETTVMHKKLLTTKDQKAYSSVTNARNTAGNRRLSAAAEPTTLPTKAAKTGVNHTFTGDVVISQQQQQQQQPQQLQHQLHRHTSQPPPLHHLSNRKPKKQQRRSSSHTLAVSNPNTNTKNTNSSVETRDLEAQAGCSTQQQQKQQQQQQQQSVHSTTISEEQLIQIQSEDQIDGTSKILAVPTQPIPGYNETFLLCTLVNNNYKPIDNVPLYLDHDLNQLVPVPLEALNGQPNLIVNHPAPEEIVNQQTSPLHQRNNCNAAAANSSLAAGGLKSTDAADSSTQQMICLQTDNIESSPVPSDIARSMENSEAVVNEDSDEQMAVFIPPECGAELPSDNAVILNIEGQQIILDAATFAHLLANPDANTQLITDDGTEFVLTREVLAALEAQQDTQEEAAVEQQHQLEQQMQQAHQITEAGPTDILAVALAGTDLYGSEVLEIETSQGLQLVGADGIVFQTAALPQAHLTPPITAQTSETSTLLNQTPIMSTLEKPSTSGKRKPQNASVAELFAAAVSADNLPTCRPNLDDSLAVIGVTAQSSTIPTSLELPITVTNPAIAPKSTMAGPTAPVGLSSTSTVVVSEAVQFQCLPHRTGLAGNDPEEGLNDDDEEFGEDYFFNRAIN